MQNAHSACLECAMHELCCDCRIHAARIISKMNWTVESPPTKMNTSIMVYVLRIANDEETPVKREPSPRPTTRC